MAVKSLTDTQKFSMEVPVSRRGVEYVPEGISWTAPLGAEFIVLTPDPVNPLKCEARAITAGIGQIMFKCDKDPGDGVVEAVRLLDFVIGPGLADVGEISAGDPVEQTPAENQGTSGAIITS